MALIPDARAFLSTASSVPPSGPGGYAALQQGIAAVEAHRFSDALRYFDNAINQISEPRMLAGAYANRGTANCWLGRTEQAKADYDRAIRTWPRDPEIYHAAGFEMFRAGRDAEAAAYFALGLKAARKNAVFLNSVAWFLATSPAKSLRNGTEAIRYAQEACNMSHWKTPNYIDTLAAAEAEAGDFSSAIKHEQLFLASRKLMPEVRIRAEQRLRKFEKHQPFHEHPERKLSGHAQKGEQARRLLAPQTRCLCYVAALLAR